MNKKFALFAAVVILAIVVVAIVSRRMQPPAAEARFAASVYPLAFLLERVTGEAVYQVTPAGVEPHDFETSPQEVLRLRDKDLFVYNGAGLDAWAERLQSNLAGAPVRTLDMVELLQSRGITLRAGEEDRASIDPHIWLDPVLVKTEVEILLDELAKLNDARATVYQQNAQTLQDHLSALDSDYRAGLASCRLHSVVVSHDAFGYLADRYGFEVIAIAGLSTEQQPSAKRLGELAELVREQGIKHIFFETLVSPKLSETLAEETGTQTLVLNPIEGLTTGDRAAGKDYFALMRENLVNLRTAMDCK